MKSMTRAAMAAPVLGLTALIAFAGPASAAEGSVRASLSPTPVSPGGGSGTATVQISGTNLSFTLAAQGLLAGAEAPHAAHIHFGATARNECPTAADNNAAALTGETDPHEHFTTTEGAPAYGEIVVSLTKTGDTSPASALAVDRFAAGDKFEYSRGDVQVSEGVAQAILAGKAVVVVHGVDYDKDGKYSVGKRGNSELPGASALPGEATDPALCGVLNVTPRGGVAAGDGSASTDEAGTLPYVLGGLAFTAAGGAAFAARRNSRATV